ncbi:hypothetical protein M9979_06195 [Sphingomonas sp. RP10(2022)]|uniref:Uncharacterized protein n=1 Tax=Sphingomonas liriopis TaxID=2949094 RepID=A0A9X2HRD5_9SPHN|nr:hypothetical protein [Sphingomonas liriopis]MCP3734467.1 hypothetical protein [Sphingomonas liriopis]
MSYHFPNERRRVERRVAPAGAYTGPERRRGERRATEVKLVRKAEPMNRGVLWAAVLMVLVVADSAFLGGAYRHMLIDGLSRTAETVRDWSAHVWDWRA